MRFGDDSDVNVAGRAIRHLAMYYCVLHARAAEFHVTRSLDWDARAIAFKLQVGEDPHARHFNVLYPREGSSFTDDDAWSLIDRVVDPTRRGALLPICTYIAAFLSRRCAWDTASPSSLNSASGRRSDQNGREKYGSAAF